MIYAYTVKKLADGSCEGHIPDLDVFTKGATIEEVTTNFSSGLSAMIETEFRKKRQKIPLPGTNPETTGYALYVPVQLQMRILLWNLMRDRKISGVELAKLLGISRQMAQQYVNGSDAVSVRKYEQALQKLGCFPTVTLQ